MAHTNVIAIYDSHGEHIDFIKQWDTDRVLVFRGEGVSLANISGVQVAYKYYPNSLQLVPMAVAGDDVTVTLLGWEFTRMASPLVFYFKESLSEGETRTAYTVELDVVARQKPISASDAEYERRQSEMVRESREAARASGETARVNAERDRQTAEAARIAAENARQQHAAISDSAEVVRARNETDRQAAETARATAEIDRGNAETVRAAAETMRAAAEASRTTAEASRATAETDRDNAETVRVQHETARQTAETARATAETARTAAEATRQTAEAARIVTTERAAVAADAATAAASDATVAAEAANQAVSALGGMLDTSLTQPSKAAEAAAVGAKFDKFTSEEWIIDQTIPTDDMTVYAGKTVNASTHALSNNSSYTSIAFTAPATGQYVVTPSSMSQFRILVYSDAMFDNAHFLWDSKETSLHLSAGEVVIAKAASVTLSIAVTYGTDTISRLAPTLPLSTEQNVEVKQIITGKLADILDDGYQHLDGDWALNDWTSFSGTASNRKYRVRYTEIVEFDRDISIVMSPGFYVAGYIDGGGTISATKVALLPAGARAHIYVRRAVEDSSEVADIATFSAACHISTCIAAIERDASTFADVTMFGRVGVCGDSYAAGGGIISGVRALTWGKNLERQAGVTVDIYAKSGQNVVQWVTDANRGLLALLAGEECGLYWLQHGINGTSKPEAMGTPADMSADPRPDTFYGKYVEAVLTIKAAFPQARIVLATITGSSYGLSDTQYQDVNTAIAAIAEYCAVPCIDILADDFYKSRYYADNNRSNHPTAMTASGMAAANRRLISKCIQDNPSYFVEYGSTGHTIKTKNLSSNDYTDSDKEIVTSVPDEIAAIWAELQRINQQINP